MKKLVSIILVIALLASSLLLTSCDAVALVSGLGKIFGFLKPLVSDHTHIWGPLLAVESTCTEHGLTEGKVCLDCGEIFVPQTETPLAAHQTITIPGYAPTCDATGLTDGMKCQNCFATIIEGHVRPMIPHSYKVLPAEESSCTTHGLTEGRQCRSCEKIFVEQQQAPLNGHTYSDDSDMDCNVCSHQRRNCSHTNKETLSARAATCTRIGLTEGKRCKDCGEILLAQKAIEVSPHAEITIPAVAATCSTAGLTAGKACGVCGEITVAQTVVSPTSHMWSASIAEIAATSSIVGTKKHHKCTTCDAVSLNGRDVCARVDLIIPALNDNGQVAEVLDFISNGDGTCYVSGIGTYKSKDIVIPATSPDGDRVTAIGEMAFYGLGEMNSIVIPASVRTICKNAFYGCKIGTVNYTGSEDQWNDIIIENGNVALGTITRLHANDFGLGMQMDNIGGVNVVGGNGHVVKGSGVMARLGSNYHFNVSSIGPVSSAYYHGVKTVPDPSSPKDQVLMFTATNSPALQTLSGSIEDLRSASFGDSGSCTLTLELSLGAVDGKMPNKIESFFRHRPEGKPFADLYVFYVNEGEVCFADGTVIGKIPESGMRRFRITIDTLAGKFYGYAEDASSTVETTFESIINSTFNSMGHKRFKLYHDAYVADPVANADLACYESLYAFFTKTEKFQHYMFMGSTRNFENSDFETGEIEVNGVMTKVKNADGSFNMAAVKALAERDYSFLLDDFNLGFKTVNCNYTGK